MSRDACGDRLSFSQFCIRILIFEVSVGRSAGLIYRMEPVGHGTSCDVRGHRLFSEAYGRYSAAEMKRPSLVLLSTTTA